MDLENQRKHFKKCAAHHRSEGRHHLANAYLADMQITEKKISIRKLQERKQCELDKHYGALRGES